MGSQEQHRQRRGLGVRGQRGGRSWPLPTRDMQKGLCTCLCGRRRLLSWTLSPTQGGKEAPVLPDIWVKPGARVWGGLGLRVKGIPGQREGFDVREAPGQRPWRVGVQKGKTRLVSRNWGKVSRVRSPEWSQEGGVWDAEGRGSKSQSHSRVQGEVQTLGPEALGSWVLVPQDVKFETRGSCRLRGREV